MSAKKTKRPRVVVKPLPENVPVPLPNVICARCGHVGMTLFVSPESRATRPGLNSASNPKGREFLFCNADCTGAIRAGLGAA